MTYRPIPSNEFIGWYEIPGYAGYCASRKGEILTKKTKNTTFGGRAGRYLKVSVYRDGDAIPHLQYVHVLVCRAFYGIAAPGMVVKHGDDNRFNNKPNNLSWGTQSDNILDTYRNGLRQPTYGPRRVALEEYDVNDRMVTLYNEDYAMSLLKSLADELPVSHIPVAELDQINTDFVTEEQYTNADVLTPLIVVNGVSYQLVDGFYRLAHHRRLQSVEIPVKIIEPASLNLEVGVEAFALRTERKALRLTSPEFTIFDHW